MELRGLCGRRAEPPIQTDTSNKRIRGVRSLARQEPRNRDFENPQIVNKLKEEGSILTEIDAHPKPEPEQNRYIQPEKRPDKP